MRFERRDVADGLPGRYDVVTAFDVLHDATRPLDLLRAIRRALADDGVLLCLEPASAERLEENAGPVFALSYGTSILYCLSISLGEGGPGLGTYGLPEPRLRALCAQAGFGSLERTPIEALFQTVYAIRP